MWVQTQMHLVKLKIFNFVLAICCMLKHAYVFACTWKLMIVMEDLLIRVSFIFSIIRLKGKKEWRRLARSMYLKKPLWRCWSLRRKCCDIYYAGCGLVKSFHKGYADADALPKVLGNPCSIRFASGCKRKELSNVKELYMVLVEAWTAWFL